MLSSKKKLTCRGTLRQVFIRDSQFLAYIQSCWYFQLSFVISLVHPEKRYTLHCKKRLEVFPFPDGMSLTKLSLDGNYLFPDGMSLTKLSLDGNNLIIPGMESLVSDIPAGDGKIT
jgi:hypothetical protein